MHLNLSKKHIYISAIVVCLIVLLLDLTKILALPGGEDSKEMVVNVYLNSIELGDEEGILSIIPKTHIAQKEVHQIVTSWGKGSLRDVTIEYRSDFGLTRSIAIIHGTYVTQQGVYDFQDKIFLQQINGRWFLILGRHRDGLDPTIYPPSKL